MTIAIALSGGIDSLVAGYLLKRENADVFGVHFLTGYESNRHRPEQERSDQKPRVENPISAIADQLGIPLHIIDIHQIFRDRVVDYFIRGYGSGNTPNPCMVCNQQIKFGILLEEVEKMGATGLATGHYANIRNQGDRFRLAKGVDEQKDQSYFLAMLSQSQLKSIRFPLGDLTKSDVRQLAGQHLLHPISKSESQDICFIPKNSYRSFLETNLPNPPEPGQIVDRRGNVLGEHQGLHRYTIGQRRGIDCPAAAPYYVVQLDMEKNRLVVGFEDELYRNNCYISGVNWIAPKPEEPVRIKTRVRYRHRAVDSTLIPRVGDTAVIKFDTAQPAVTPGQAAVCYDGDLVVAGGWIIDPETQMK